MVLPHVLLPLRGSDSQAQSLAEVSRANFMFLSTTEAICRGSLAGLCYQKVINREENGGGSFRLHNSWTLRTNRAVLALIVRICLDQTCVELDQGRS